MPLFLTPERYLNVPLEATYNGAYRGVPRKWKAVLEQESKVVKSQVVKSKTGITQVFDFTTCDFTTFE